LASDDVRAGSTAGAEPNRRPTVSLTPQSNVSAQPGARSTAPPTRVSVATYSSPRSRRRSTVPTATPPRPG